MEILTAGMKKVFLKEHHIKFLNIIGNGIQIMMRVLMIAIIILINNLLILLLRKLLKFLKKILK